MSQDPQDDENDPFDDTHTKSGRVRFDDRGNAVWEPWSGRRLDHPALKLADEPPALSGKSVDNPQAAVTGYNPYHSGMLARERHKKKDLRALSKWIELQKNLGQKSGG